MDKYYLKEKIFNTVGITLVMFCIFKGISFVFKPAAISTIVLIRAVLMKKYGKIESIVLFLLLCVGYLWQYEYYIIHYFEYVMLAFFFVFLIYYYIRVHLLKN